MEHSTQDTEAFAVIDLKHLLGLLRQQAWLLILVTALGIVAAYLTSKLQTPIYQAKTSAIITRPSSEGPVTDITQALTSQQITQTYVELLSQRWVLDNVAERVGGEISEEHIKVSAALNTQIIDIVVEDPDPARAVKIANMLVQLLIEQNAIIQSGRYTEAEKSLDVQIQKIEEQITSIQTQLNRAKSDALAEQLAATEKNIESTRATIAAVETEIDNLKSLTAEQARATLASDNRRLEKLKAQLAGQESEAAEATRQEIQFLQQEIDRMTPLVGSGMIEKTLAERQRELALQQALLLAYQKTYIDLLTSGKIEGTTDEISNLEMNLNLYQQIYLGLLDDRETVHLLHMQNMPNVVQVNPAATLRQPVRPRLWINIALGGLIPLILVIALLFLIEFFDDTVKSADQVNEQLKLPVIGYITKIQRKPKNAPIYEYPHLSAVEAFRILRTNLEFENARKPIKSLLVTSPNDNQEKSNVTANLVIVLAQGGKRVLVIDADLRNPQIHRSLGLTNDKGLSDMIRDSASFEQVRAAWKDENLAVITSGDLPPNPADLLASEKMTDILNCAREKADIIVIDAPSFLVADASILAAKVDGVLLVIQPGQTPMGTAQFTIAQLQRVGVRVFGVVLNQIPRGFPFF